MREVTDPVEGKILAKIFIYYGVTEHKACYAGIAHDTQICTRINGHSGPHMRHVNGVVTVVEEVEN